MEMIDESTGKVIVKYPYPMCKSCLETIGYCIAGNGKCPFREEKE